MNLILRCAQECDSAILCEYNRLLAWETEHKELNVGILQAGVLAMLHDPNKGRYFVAEHEGKVIGQLGVTYEWSDWRDGTFWWIQSVYVAEVMRRKGVFRRLYAHVYQAALADQNVIGLRLYVEHNNQRAQAAYQHLGMVMTHYHIMEQCPLSSK